MKSLDEQIAALGMTVSTQVPYDLFVSHTQAIALMAKTAKKGFEQKVLGGEAKPEVWANNADFNKRMDEFVTKTQELADAAKSGGLPLVMEKMVPALTCKGCHDTYREKK